MAGMLAMLLPAVPLAAQTQIDLSSQSKRVDFSEASWTKPMKIGISLPATCSTGETYFKINSASGQNIYGCVATNTWVLQAGGGTAGPGTVTLQNNGTVVGARDVANFVAGAGFVNAISDTGSRIDIQQSVDTAIVHTRADSQAGTTLYCASASGSASSYTCSMNPALGAYTLGMVLRWKPDITGAGGAITLNVDSLGAKAVKLADGSTPTVADIRAGSLHHIWYDGTDFRLMESTRPLASGTRPACDDVQRGRIWHVFGGSGIKDDVAVCAKDTSDAYAWRVVY